MADPSSKSSEEMQKFLDENQYTVNGILRYEKIFGEGFVSTGGLETTKVYYNFSQHSRLSNGEKTEGGYKHFKIIGLEARAHK